jgi:hypothetical protein
VLVGDGLEGLGADLLLALDEKPQRDRDLAKPLERLERVDARHNVRLVVGDSARDDAAVFLDRLERVRVPQVDRVHRLHVVVLIKEQLAAARARHLRVERRHPALIERLDSVGEPAQAAGDPVPRGPNRIQAVIGDAREGAQLFELLDEASGVLLDIRVDGAG